MGVTDTVTIAQFIESNRIVSGSYRVDGNPNMDGGSNMDHWKVTIKRSGHTLTTYFSKGYGHHGAEPTTAEILSCLADDSSTVDNAGDFEDFCNELGYDTDSRKAEKTFKVCEHQAKRLRSFLGDSLYKQLLYDTERE